MGQNHLFHWISCVLFFFLSAGATYWLAHVELRGEGVRLPAWKTRSHEGCFVTAVSFLGWQLLGLNDIDMPGHSIQFSKTTQRGPALAPGSKNNRLSGHALGWVGTLHFRGRIVDRLAIKGEGIWRGLRELLRAVGVIGEKHAGSGGSVSSVRRVVVCRHYFIIYCTYSQNEGFISWHTHATLQNYLFFKGVKE